MTVLARSRGQTRLDMLQRYFHYPNTAFVQALRERGFVVSQQARSPYSDSESNIAAALNMAYLDGLPRILGARSQDVRPVRRVIADSRASRLLKSLGYRYVHLDTDEVTFPFRNPRLSSAFRRKLIGVGHDAISSATIARVRILTMRIFQ